MNCLIVDDSKISREVLKKMVELDTDLNLMGECKNATEAYQLILEKDIDLLLLDIEMPGMSGVELVKSLGAKTPLVIFITSLADYAVEAFDLAVVDFMVKPVTSVRFMQAIDKAKEIKGNKGHQSIKITEDDFIFIRDASVIRKLKIEDILFFEAMGDYVKVFVDDRFYTIHSTLKSVEDKIPQAIFFRVHRSFIINISKIDTLESGLITIRKNNVPVSDSYRAALNKRMQIL